MASLRYDKIKKKERFTLYRNCGAVLVEKWNKKIPYETSSWYHYVNPRRDVHLEKSEPQMGPLLTTESPVAQWLEHPTRSRRVVGSYPIWGSDFSESMSLLEFT